MVSPRPPPGCVPGLSPNQKRQNAAPSQSSVLARQGRNSEPVAAHSGCPASMLAKPSITARSSDVPYPSTGHGRAISPARSSACEHGTMTASTRTRGAGGPRGRDEAGQHPVVALGLRHQPLLGRLIVGPLAGQLADDERERLPGDLGRRVGEPPSPLVIGPSASSISRRQYGSSSRARRSPASC